MAARLCSNAPCSWGGRAQVSHGAAPAWGPLASQRGPVHVQPEKIQGLAAVERAAQHQDSALSGPLQAAGTPCTSLMGHWPGLNGLSHLCEKYLRRDWRGQARGQDQVQGTSVTLVSSSKPSGTSSSRRPRSGGLLRASSSHASGQPASLLPLHRRVGTPRASLRPGPFAQ